MQIGTPEIKDREPSGAGKEVLPALRYRAEHFHVRVEDGSEKREGICLPDFMVQAMYGESESEKSKKKQENSIFKTTTI